MSTADTKYRHRSCLYLKVLAVTQMFKNSKTLMCCSDSMVYLLQVRTIHTTTLNIIRNMTLSYKSLKRNIGLLTLAVLVQTSAQAAENPDGVQQGDPNPGSVPSTILAEMDSLEIANLGGHKIYAGTGHRRNEPSYFNMDFDCDGTGTYETYFSDDHSFSSKIAKGTFEWTVRDDGARVTATVTKVTQGSRFNDSLLFSMRPRASSAVIVGQTIIERTEASRIVQHTKCEDAQPASTTSDAESTNGYSSVLFYKNPGAIPSTILEEVDEIIVANLGGIKVFAGPDTDHPTTEDYFNIQFDCDGTGTFESYPSDRLHPFVKSLHDEAEGIISWVVNKRNDHLDIDITKFTKNKLLVKNDISLRHTVSMKRIATIGKSTVEYLIISRMVRYKECS